MPQSRIVSKTASSVVSSHQISITRRQLLAALGATAISAAFPPLTRAQKVAATSLSRRQIEQILKPLFQTDNPAMFNFAVDVYQHCIFGRMQPAEPPLKHPWLIPGGVYVGQWIWDTTFLTDLLAIVPHQQEFIRGIYQNYWDSQQRWTAAKPTTLTA